MVQKKVAALHAIPAPPRPLGEAGLALWRRVQREYSITDVCGAELLLLACEATDRAAVLRREIDHDGAVLRAGDGGVKDNPLLNVENITITPHTAGPTWENWPKAFRNAFDNILRVHAGRKPMWVIPELRDLVS